MSNIVLLFFSVVCFLAQVGFSIFYSINIVDISAKANQIQKKLETNQIEIQQLKNQYFEQSSLTTLQNNPTTKELRPVTKKIQIAP